MVPWIKCSIDRVLNCGLKLQTDGFGLDTEIGILSYLAFVQDVELKSVLNEMVKVNDRFTWNWSQQQLKYFFLNRIHFTAHRRPIN